MPSRRHLHGARFAVAILASLALAGCGKTNQCKTGTVFVTVTFSGDASRAKKVQVVTSTEGGTAHQAMTPVSHAPGSATGTIWRSIFQTVTRRGSRFEVTLTALDDGGQPIASGSNNTGPLQAACATLAITIGGTDGGRRVRHRRIRGPQHLGYRRWRRPSGAGASGTGGSGGAPAVGGSSGAGVPPERAAPVGVPGRRAGAPAPVASARPAAPRAGLGRAAGRRPAACPARAASSAPAA